MRLLAVSLFFSTLALCVTILQAFNVENRTNNFTDFDANYASGSIKRTTSYGCFDLHTTKDSRASNILIDKCTGETWVLQYLEVGEGEEKYIRYGWNKLTKTANLNNFMPYE